MPDAIDDPIVAGELRIRSPIIAAAGPHVGDGEGIARAVAGGAAAVVTKTIGIRPARLPKPSMASVGEQSLLHVPSTSEIPADLWLTRELPLGLLAARRAGVPVIASVGFTRADALELAPRAAAAGADAIEVNLGATPAEEIKQTVVALDRKLDVPLWLKLGAARTDLADIARATAPFVSALSLVDGFPAGFAVDPATARPCLDRPGTISGPLLKPVAAHAIHAIARTLPTAIIGVGGVRTATDAIELMMAGAAAVGVCTAAILEGPEVYGRLAIALRTWMQEHDYVHTTVVGASDRTPPRGASGTPVPPPTLDLDRCDGAGPCARACPYGAIEMVDDHPEIDPLRCVRCGLCVTLCPTRAWSFGER